jgi:cell wall assembly regulator SMI1
MHEHLRQLIAALVTEIRRYAERKHDPARMPAPNPPATSDEIRALESHIGRRLPDSYRAFLELHNGFTNLAYPGDMLRVVDMLPGSRIYERIREWKRMTAQYGGGEVLDGVVIADGNEPNHWVYLDPNAPTSNNEWAVVAHTPSDDSTYPDLPAYLESRIEEMQTIHKHMDEGRI